MEWKVEETWKEVLRDRVKSITLSWEPKEVSNCRTVGSVCQVGRGLV